MRSTLRLFLAICLVSCLFTGLLSYVGYNFSKNIVQEALVQEKQAISEAISQAILEKLEFAANTAKIIAKSPMLIRYVESLANNSSLPAKPSERLSAFLKDANVSVYTAHGQLVQKSQTAISNDFVKNVLPLTLMQERQWFSLIDFQNLDKNVYFYTLPLLTSANEALAVLLYPLELPAVLARLKERYLTFSGYHMCFIKKDGEFLLTGGATSLFSSIPIEKRRALFAQNRATVESRLEGHDYVLSVQRISGTDWAILFASKNTLGGMQANKFFFVAAAFVVSLILAFFCHYLVKRHRDLWEKALTKWCKRKRLPEPSFTDLKFDDVDSLLELFQATFDSTNKKPIKGSKELYEDLTLASVRAKSQGINEQAKTILQEPQREKNIYEALTRYIFDYSPTGVFVEHKGIATVTNASLNKMIALNDDKKLLPAFVDPEDFYFISKQSKESSGLIQREVRVHSPGGGEKTVRVSCMLLKSSGEDYTVAWMTDITELKKIQHKLIEAHNFAQNAIQTKTIFIANMNHEIRTPMNAIMGMSHLLLQTELTKRQEGYVQKISSAVKSLLGIVNDVLDFSKIEEGNFNIDEAIFDFHECISTIVASYKSTDSIAFSHNISEEVPNYIKSDAVRIKQILINLLDNAFKFTSEGSVNLHVFLKTEDLGNKVICIAVEDTGIGIDQEQIDTICQPFTQADTSRTRQYGGTGLGLALSQQLAHILKGNIEIVSSLGEGSTFCLCLPFVSPAASEVKNLSRSIQHAKTLHDLRILIYEDKEQEHSIEHIFTRLGISSHSLGSAEEFVKHSQEIGPESIYDAFFIDWTFSQKDSPSLFQLLENLEQEVHIPPVFLIINGEEYAQLSSEYVLPSIARILERPISPSYVLGNFIQFIGESHWAKIAQVKYRTSHPIPILLVEDSPINQQVTTELLESMGASVTIANNGQEALDILRENDFELVFMDIQMPVMDGISAAKEIRTWEGYESLPIIAMTAHAQDSDRALSLAAGMNDHLAKPLDPQGLIASLRYWLPPESFVMDETSPGREQDGDTGFVEGQKAEGDCGFAALRSVDCKGALSRLLSNEKLYAKLLLRFKEENESIMQRMHEQIEQAPFEVQVMAHTLKSTSANLGIQKVSEAASAVESYLKSHQKEKNAPLDAQTKQKVVALLEELAWHLQKYLEEFSTAEEAVFLIANPDAKPAQDEGQEAEGKQVIAQKVELSQEDLAEFSNLLSTVREKLALYDTSAMEDFERISQLLGPAYASELKNFSQAMERYDFEAAEESLVKLEEDVQAPKNNEE